MGRPSFQFYPKDWHTNANLRRCSHAARGAWMDVMCVLHDSDTYGLVRWPLAELANAAGAPVKLLRELVDKSVLKGADKGACPPLVYIPRSGRKDGDPVTLVPEQPGPIWYSSRMVRDEYVRTIRGESGRPEGAADPPKPTSKPPPKAASKASPKPPLGATFGPRGSSSSSSDSSLRSESPPAIPAGLACRAMKTAGVPDVNPSDPELLSLLNQGVTPEQLADLVTELRSAGRSGIRARYVIRTMAGRLRDAAATTPMARQEAPAADVFEGMR